jgi:hypothetical protein
VTVSSQEDNDLPSESDLRSRLVALMGGRAAEEILFHEVTGGASNDFEAANRIATSMVTKWGMGHDPEDRDGGVSGRGQLSFFVQTNGNGIPSEVRPAATRAIRAILDEAYGEASRTLVANLETLRRLAAYLVEHERVDGETFDELFDGRRAVPNAGDEWRAATSRPRDWGDVVDLADRRTKRAPESVVAAASGAPASSGTEGVVAAIAPAPPDAAAAHDAARPLVETIGAGTAIEGAGLTADDGPSPLTSVAAGGHPATARRRRVGSGQRIRLVAAELLRRAEARLRTTEAGTDRI